MIAIVAIILVLTAIYVPVRYCTRSPGLIYLIEVVVFILVSLWALLLGSVLFNQLVA